MLIKQESPNLALKLMHSTKINNGSNKRWAFRDEKEDIFANVKEIQSLAFDRHFNH